MTRPVQQKESYVKKIKKEISKLYFMSEPFAKYVNLCGISTTDLMQIPGRDKFEHEEYPENDELCIELGFIELPPAEILEQIPRLYKNVRVYRRHMGRI